MMEDSKIHFSEAETDLMKNAAIILTKNSVLNKMKQLLEGLQQDLEQVATTSTLGQQDIITSVAKISRGENYLGLPYLVLDYPRKSDSAGLFFIRNMFWWGHFFSTTLHVSGIYKKKILPALSTAYADLQKCFIGVHEDQWVHHFESDNYVAISSLTEKAFLTLCENGDHLKIAVSQPLDTWPQARENMQENWKLMLKVSGLITDAV